VLVLVDVDWRYVAEPFAQRAGQLGWAYTTASVPIGEWTHAVEASNATILAKADRPLNRDLRAAYAGCVQWEDERFAVLDGARCAGLGASLSR